MNQRSIIESYALKFGHTIVGESCDDNISGMHFDRDGIEQLTEAVDAGLLICGDCDSTFVPRIRCWNGSRRAEYLCKSYMHHGKDFCPAHRIRESELYAEIQRLGQEIDDLLLEKIQSGS